MTRNVATPRELQPRPLTQYNFRELAQSTLTDPDRDSTNVAANQPWPSEFSHPLVEIEPGQSSNDIMIPITFYIYERSEWKVASVLSVDPSDPSSLERMVRGYKRQEMFVYDKDMQTVSVSSSFQAATADWANALLLIPRTTREQMDKRQPIEPPSISGRSKRVRVNQLTRKR